MKIVIIGSGNVATILGKKIMGAGHSILEVAGRNMDAVKVLADILHAAAVYDINNITKLADIYIIAVADSAIKALASELRVEDKIVVHTAAAEPINILNTSSSRYGVIYPLQTLRKEANVIPPIPILINGNNQETINTLQEFCMPWAEKVQPINDEQRLKMHVAAVFANNFTNHLFALTQKYCEENNIDFSLLFPIIDETINRIKTNNAATIQTGPAIRNDNLTVEKHLKLLHNHPKLQSLYLSITNSIKDFNSTNE